MKRIIRKIHLWLSIPAGLFISLICFTGAILVFETEITEYTNSERYFVNGYSGKQLSVSEIVQKASLGLPDSVSVSSIQIPSDKRRTYRLGIEGQNRTSVYVNPYSGSIIEKYTYDPNSFFAQVRQLHRWLMFKDNSRIIGKRIVGISTIVMIVILLTGFVVWLPRNRKVLKSRLRIRFKSGWSILWYDLHVAGGFYAALLLLVMALTGLTWSFEWYRKGFYGAFGVEMQQSQQASGRGGGQARDKDRSKIDYTVWDKVVDETLKNIKSYKTLIVTNEGVNILPNRGLGNSRASDHYKFDRKTGELTEASPYAKQPKQGKMRAWIYSIHTGSWGGVAVKILYFIVALIGGLLPLTGYYLWIKKKWRQVKC